MLLASLSPIRAIALTMGVAHVLAGASGVSAQDLAVEIAPFSGMGASNLVVAVTETADGRLWCAFRDRLQFHGARGVREIVWDSPSPESRIHTVRCLTGGPDGTLWVGTTSGLWRVAPGADVARHCEQLGTASVWCLSCDSAGALWAATSAGIVCADPNGAPRAAEAGVFGQLAPGESVDGILVHEQWCYAWGRGGLFRCSASASHRGWDHLEAAPRGVAAVLAVGDRLWTVSAEGLHQLDDGGGFRPIWRGTDLAQAADACVVDGRVWLSHGQRLWAYSIGDGVLRSVAQFEGGARRPETSISAVCADSHGILWLGTEHGLQRAVIAPGIENILLVAGDDDQMCAALAEQSDGRVAYVQGDGRLFEQFGNEWREVEAPWGPPTGPGRRIEHMGADREGGLWVCSRSSGLWHRRAGEWRRVGAAQGIDGARWWTQASDGAFWVAGLDLVWRIDPDGAIELVDVPKTNTATKARPSLIVQTRSGRIWLGTYSSGVFGFVGDRAFAPEAFDGGSTAIVDMVPWNQPGQDELMAVTTDGLQRLDPSRRLARIVVSRNQWGVLRSVAPAAGRAMWAAGPRELHWLDPEGGSLITFPPRLGGHPLPYSFRARMVRRNGEVWFGARGGYTRVAPTVTSAPRWPLQYLGCEVVTPGKVTRLGHDGVDRVAVTSPGGSFSLLPALVDRSRDSGPTAEIVLQNLERGFEQRSTTGTFEQIPPGDYDVALVVSRIGGATDVMMVGHVTVESPWPQWPLWFVVSFALVAGVSVWRRARLQSRRRRRRVAVEHVLTRHGRDPDQVLDIAFLAVSAAEQCVDLTKARHASVWLRDLAENHRILLAEFGVDLPDAESRADCRWADQEQSGTLNVVVLDGEQDVLVHARDPGEMQFEILLHACAAKDEATLDRLRAAVMPLAAAIRKLSLLDRLESEQASMALALAEDLHDLRSPLTTLRLGAYELGRRIETSDPKLQELSRLIADAVTEILDTINGIETKQRRGSGTNVTACDPWSEVVGRLPALAILAESKAIRLDVVPPEGACLVLLDRHWFGRAVDNVVGNAVKYSPAGSRVCIRGQIESGAFLLRVEDEGAGFRPSELDSVFLPGVVGSAMTSGGERKSGFGLWIARQAIRAVDGDLWIEPRPFGSGAHVCLKLPLASESDAESSDACASSL